VAHLNPATSPLYARASRPGQKQLLSQANERASSLYDSPPVESRDPQGIALRQLRLAKNLDAATLASQACLSVPQLYELESGESSLFYSSSLRNQAGRRVARLLDADWDTLTTAQVALPLRFPRQEELSMPDAQQHWDKVYQSKPFDTVSWYTPHLGESLRLIEALCPDRTAAVVDIGGGESTLVDDLLAKGYCNLSVLDISAAAIDFTRQRLGSKASLVDWHVGDITTHDFGSRKFDLWHDRAVFHFLTDASARAKYIDLVKRAVKPGGHVVMATFGPQGPLQCSGLDVVRYDGQTLHDQFGDQFQLMGSQIADHATPMGTHQQFLYCWCKVSH